MNFKIFKANGRVENFSRKKLYTSLKRCGLPHQQCQEIANKVLHEIGEGTKTRDIYKKTLKLVDQSSHVAAIHYSLKKSLFELGPTGLHFETYVARYFEELGFQAKTCQVLNGRLVKHEVDVIAHKNGKRIFAECKFHNRTGIKNDIKIALYVKARWDDLREGPEGENLSDFYLVSNTAFTLDAITYSAGCGLKLLGVNSPKEISFLEEIKAMKLFPITSLKRLPRFLRNDLLNRNIILAREILQHTHLLLAGGMSEHQINQLSKEIDMLLGGKK